MSVSGRGTVSGAGTYEAGRTVTLQATPVRGHRFVRWRGDATGSSISATIQMNEHKVVEALFERDDSTSLGSSDQIELRSEQPFSGVAIGDIITLRATVTRPNGGRVADATPVELTSQDQGVLMSLERTALSTRNGEVSARFVVVRLGRVVLLTQAAGDVLVSTVNVGGQSRFQVRVTARPASGGRVSGAGSYQSGRQIALRATPNEGFRFVRWEGGASGTRSSLTLRVTADATVRAVFERSSYTLTVQANPADGSAGRVEVEGGTLVRPGQKRFTSGERATLTAHTNTGWSFGGWSGDLRGSQSVQSIVIDADKTVTAQWVRSEQRAALFSSRSLPDRTWQVGQPVNSTLPAASGGSGRFTYSIRYEWNGNQTWTPAGVSFDRNSRRLSGVPRMQLDPNPALRRFTVFLRADDRGRTGQWDELQFVVNLRPAPTAQPTSSTTETVSAQIVARRLSDGRIEFALQPAGAARILPRSRFFPARPRINSWLNSTEVVHRGTTLGRISARRLSDGRTEFSFLPTSSSDRFLPRTRMFPSSTANRSWLHSNTFAIPVASDSGPTVLGPQQCTPVPRLLRAVRFGDSFSYEGRGVLDETACESPRFPEHYADRFTFTLNSPQNVLITLTTDEPRGGVGMLALLAKDGQRLIALGDHTNAAAARVERRLGVGTYIIEVNAIEPHPAYRVATHTITEGCRTIGPIAAGIEFPQTNVKLSDASPTVYRVTGQAAQGGRVVYYMCADNQSISEDTRDKVLYTAAVRRLFLPAATQLTEVRDEVDKHLELELLRRHLVVQDWNHRLHRSPTRTLKVSRPAGPPTWFPSTAAANSGNFSRHPSGRAQEPARRPRTAIARRIQSSGDCARRLQLLEDGTKDHKGC